MTEELTLQNESERTENVIRNRTVMTVENTLRATKAQRKKVKILLILLIAILFGAVALIFAVDALESGDPFDWVFPAVMGVLLVVFVLWVLFGFDKSTAKTTEKLLDYTTEELDYEFGEAEILVHERFGEGVSMDMRFAYRRLKNVIEYDGFFTFSVIKTAVYMVDKAGMTEQAAEELAARLKERLGAQFIVKRKKRK